MDQLLLQATQQMQATQYQATQQMQAMQQQAAQQQATKQQAAQQQATQQQATQYYNMQADEEIKRLNKKNKKLKKIVALQGEQIERNRMVTEALLTGLFDPNLQACAYGRHLTLLNGKPPHWYTDERWAFEEWGSRFPTTVQGDANEKRIGELEEKTKKSEEQLEYLAENVEGMLQERDEKLTMLEERLLQLETQIAILEKNQLERFALTTTE